IASDVSTACSASGVHSKAVSENQVARIRSGKSADGSYATRSGSRAVLWRTIERESAHIGVFSAFKGSKHDAAAHRQSHVGRSADSSRNIEHLTPKSAEASGPCL